MIGAGLLWFGWFGFNAGSELAADITAAGVWVNTMVATGAAMLGWLAHGEDPRRPRHLARRGLRSRRRTRRHHPGLLVGQRHRRDHRRRRRRRGVRARCRAEVQARLRRLARRRRCAPRRWLDRHAHGRPAGDRGGAVNYGNLASVLRRRLHPARQAVRRGGGCTVFSFVAAYIIGTIIDKTMGFRCSEEEEITGIDLSIHAESAYELGSFTGAGYAALRRPREERGVWRHEAHHRNHQALQARRCEERARDLRCARHHRVGGQWLRAAAWAHRGLPGSGVHRRPRAQGSASRCSSTTAMPTTSST